MKLLLPLLLFLSLMGRPDMAKAAEHAPLFVSVEGSDDHAGTREAPLATLKKALELLPAEKGGEVVLLEGRYRQRLDVELPGEMTEAAARLPALRVRGEGSVVFDGGETVTRWEALEGAKDVYRLKANGSEALYGIEYYLDVWEETGQVRYRSVADERAVKAWPGSVCRLDNGDLIVRTTGGTPGEVDLRRNLRAVGGAISRPNTVIEGVRFENFTGGKQARALTVTKGKNIVIRNAEFYNCLIGISNSAHATVIEDCRFSQVGMGVRHSGDGKEMVARRCVMEGAVGRFAMDLGEHQRNGIRIYHPGDGATIEDCVTVNFWAGLYIKTISGLDGSLPYHITGNTFLDGFRSGANHKQPRTYVKRNIIGPSLEMSGVGPNGKYLLEMGATLEENYFYGWGGKAQGSDLAGPEPFVHLDEGNLELRGDLSFPVPAEKLGAAGLRHVRWGGLTSRALALARHGGRPVAVAMHGEPQVTASENGALVVATYNQRPETAVLSYRQTGASEWKSVKGVANTVTPKLFMTASAPVEQVVPREYNVLFALTSGELEPNTTHEFQIRAVFGREKLETEPATLETLGKAKTLHVLAGASWEKADGSEKHPFPEIQEALDRALPGDTVRIGKGVYTRPLLLQHGGTPEARLTLEGAGMEATVLDMGKEAAVALELRKAPYVTVRGLEARWFGNTGVEISNSSHVELEHCRVWNQTVNGGGGLAGYGVVLQQSPHARMANLLLMRTQNGLLAVQSPGLHCEAITAYGNLYAGISLVNSTKDSRIVYSSLNFTGNQSLRIRESDPEAFASLVCENNNYGTRLREINDGLRKRLGGMPPEAYRPENDFTPAKRYGRASQAKQIVEATVGDGETQRFFKMETWRRFSGKDTSSIFDDPQFGDPVQGDFRPLADSPNVLKDGKVIGAFPATPRDGQAKR
ncbi:MAG TPA: hypothetical protein VNQ90_10680 [Chthoniobacteraceae bacterium]|nr:hypothetical protein [Chthoniobacteraceae bacterium]